MAARVLVAGAGAVGLSCAYFLQRTGCAVTVLDAGPVGGGASWGNAGWVSPSLSAPIPGPAAMATALRSIGKPDSPLWLRPQPDPAFALWGLGFLRHCTRASSERGLAATALLSKDAFRFYDVMRDDGLAVGLERRGLLFIARSAAELDAELAELSRAAGLGVAAGITRLSGAACRDRQPVIGPDVAGGVFVESDGHLDPRRLTAALAAASAYFPALDWTGAAEEWTGMRPLLPDGLPVLDRVPGTANAFVATGHSTLGITLAAVTGAHMAEFVSTGTAPAALRPFRFPRSTGRPR